MLWEDDRDDTNQSTSWCLSLSHPHNTEGQGCTIDDSKKEGLAGYISYLPCFLWDRDLLSYKLNYYIF